MGRVVVVVVVLLLLLLKTILKSLKSQGTRLKRQVCSVKTFFGVGSLNVKGSNPEESFIREVRTYVG